MSQLKTAYSEIVDVSAIGKHGQIDFNDGLFEKAINEGLLHFSRDAKNVLVLAIDMQNDFITGSLPVNGSVGDIERGTRFIYDNMPYITRIMCSLDTHGPLHIFYPSWWQKPETGENPAPYTVITYEDVKNGKWQPIYGNPADSLTYLQMLEKNANKPLVIWPYHCIAGTEGANLENQFARMVYFHAAARKILPTLIRKGTDPSSEMYGIVKPEISKKNIVTTSVLNAIEEYDEIYVMGEAASHCLLESVRQIAEAYADRPDVTSRITILTDCTSPIAGYEQMTWDAFDKFKTMYNIKFAKSTEIHLS